MGTPLVPGYFADPTIRKFGDTYYLYATTDGIKLASGESQVWISKDFVNWYNYEMEIDLPPGLTTCWAPDGFSTGQQIKEIMYETDPYGPYKND